MGTYYELLAVSPGASVTEVEDAYRVGYDHWRLLVTSHDPELANRANGMLQQLETARAVLTDPQKRSAYNLSLSAEESVGGLADPTAGATPLPTLTPPSPRQIPGAVTGHLPETKACPHCGSTRNPVDARFCIQCQTSLVQACPKCKSELPWHYLNCHLCGCNIATEQKLQQQRALEERERQQKLTQEKEATLQAKITKHFLTARQLLDDGKWRLAKQELSCFAGLGPAKADEKAKGGDKQTPLCGREHPLWVEAKALNDAADATHRARRGAIVKTSGIVWGVISFVVTLVLMLPGAVFPDDLDSLALLGVAIPVGIAIVAAVCTLVWIEIWGGKNRRHAEQTIGLFAPLFMSLLLLTGIGAIGVVLAFLFLGGSGGGG